MTIEEIKDELKARKWTQAQLAEKLHMNAKALSGILCGARPLTDTLAAHISLLLEKERDCVFVYKVELPEAKVQELCGGAVCEEDRQAAIEAIIHHNLQELIELGKKCLWSEQERDFLVGTADDLVL